MSSPDTNRQFSGVTPRVSPRKVGFRAGSRSRERCLCESLMMEAGVWVHGGSCRIHTKTSSVTWRCQSRRCRHDITAWVQTPSGESMPLPPDLCRKCTSVCQKAMGSSGNVAQGARADRVLRVCLYPDGTMHFEYEQSKVQECGLPRHCTRF